ncbi:MAG TPA: GLPGLI family protein [Bacteroidales bacterium]|jgi:GLPGLI family protein|nr:hypothetical protein [Bacteroidota bacterium]HJN05330.1 GLPGLI family protein [Bacteroidales bacterium]
MKKTVLTIISLAILGFAFSQSDNDQVNNEGSVVYEAVQKLDIHLDNMSPEIQAMLPKENRSSKRLYFNQYASRYQNIKETEESSMDHESGGGMVRIMVSHADDIVYRDLKDNEIIEQKEFMSRVFLIESDAPEVQWKFTGNQKMILNYPCQEATMEGEEGLVKVWFTPAIPISSGPGEYGNLPGLILYVETNEGDNTIIAKSIELGEVDAKYLEKPKKGKKVSREKYLAIVDEKNKEMGHDHGGNTKTVTMTIQR